MKQFQIRYENEKDFDQKLSNLKDAYKDTSSNVILFYLTWTMGCKNGLDVVISKIEEHFPDADYYGNEGAGFIAMGEFAMGIHVTCFIFEEKDTRVELAWVEEGGEISSLEDLWAYCNTKQGLKAIELIPSMKYLDILKLDGNIPNISEDILIFGGSSVEYDVSLIDAEIFARGHNVTSEGMAVVLYFGKNLLFSSNNIHGWKGLGRFMEVTDSEGKIIREIDNSSAYSIYEKYLNLTMEDQDTLVFPLIVNEDGIEYLRTPRIVLPDKSLQMFANIPEGTKVRIAYGDKNTILDGIYEKATDIANLSPVAIKAFSCTGRRLFWGDAEVGRETRILQTVAPVCGFYTGGELLRLGKVLRVLNQTLAIITFSEKINKRDAGYIGMQTKLPDKSLVARLAYFSQKASEEQEKVQYQLEEEKRLLQDALEAADVANKSKTRFLFNMSHDIRTPMNAIIGFTNMAMKNIDDPKKTLDCLSKIQQSGNMLLSLINSVLEVSRIESGNAMLEEKPCDIEFSFANIESTLHELAVVKDINLSFEFGDITDRYVFCDFDRCMRVFVNVISNAIKYTREGGHVRVLCEQEKRTSKTEAENCKGIGYYRYTVEDNGIGMSEEFQKHIFDQFAREKTATASGVQGTGLGMTVVKSYVDLMGGTIDFVSELDKGTKFIITLPFKIQKGKDYIDPVTGQIKSSEGRAVLRKSADLLADKKVLLVEDNLLNREIAIDILEDKGLTVESAQDGSDAVGIMKEKGPDYFDFILMDIQMPIMDGYEATKAIRKMYPDSRIPIIALSANAFAEDKEKSLAAGMDDHVAKPINVDVLIKSLLKLI